MLKTRPVVPVAILATVLTVIASACGSAGSASVAQQNTQSADPLHGMTGYQIATKATADTTSAPGVQISGTVENSSQPMSFQLLFENGTNCDGTLSEPKVGSFQLTYDKGTLWVKPDNEFWRTQGGTNSAALALLEGKYLKLKAGGNGLGALVSLCSLHSLLSGGSPMKRSDFGKVTTTVYQGQRAVKILDATGKGYAYVTDTAKPEVIVIATSGSNGGTLRFSYPVPAPAITPPPASQVLDGSKYGF